MNSECGMKPKAKEWKRPAGPPIVWRIIEGQEKLENNATRRIRISIQEVPKERIDEAISHMCEVFIASETTCKYLKLSEDIDAANDFRGIWKYVLNEGACVAAYKLDSNGDISHLIGLNILYVQTEEVEKTLENYVNNFKSKGAKKVFDLMGDIASKADVYKILDVDKYICGLGLSVEPSYRGQKIGLRLLEARDDIGRKYGIHATATVFTAVSSQLQAERAGFNTVVVQNLSEYVGRDGKLLFQNAELNDIKYMIKRLK